MIEEEAVVARIDEDGQVWVEKNRQSACSSCSKGCPSATVGEYLGGSMISLMVDTALPLKTGDRVMVGIHEGALVLGALGVYLLPLISLFVGAMLGQAVGEGGEIATIIGGLIGLLASLVALKFTPMFSRQKLRPVVLRKLG